MDEEESILKSSSIFFFSIFQISTGFSSANEFSPINKLIAIDRLNKSQILQMINLVPLSNDINDLKDNLEWESSNFLN